MKLDVEVEVCMCGIAGLLNLNAEPLADPFLVRRMSKQLSHRGPDDEGVYADGPVAFGFKRLSIIDLAGGHQPLCNEDGSVWCMLNGEVYNYVELRRELEQLGHSFRTNSDTETVVHAYEQYGLEFVTRLRGMFAIALWDGPLRQLVLARDRVGKKPLYYAINGTQLAFASEIKALLPWPGLDKSIDPSALEDYLRFLYVPGPRTIFKSVKKLMPGHLLVARVGYGSYREQRYWSFDPIPEGRRDPSEVAVSLRALVADAVRVRLRSDVALGAFLSGGLDSSSVVALMSRELLCGPPLTFSMRFPEAEFDESTFARLVAGSLGTSHHEEMVEPVTPETLQRIAWHLDEPFADSSAVPTYLVCQAARRHVTVALSGDGGDELFAGYDRYRYHRLIERLARWPLPVRKWMKEFLYQSARRWVVLAPSVGERLRQASKALETTLLPSPNRPFFLNQYFGATAARQLMSPELAASRNGGSFEAEWSQLHHSNSLDGLDLFLQIDTMVGLPDDMLTKVDRMSMAHGLEVRCPLLDQNVVEFAGSIASGLKLHGRESKFILKKAIGDLLPKPILERSKRGFGAPIGTWLSTTFRELTEDCLSRESTSRRAWFQPSGVAAIRDQILSDNVEAANSMLSKHQRLHRGWALLMLELWARKYLDEPSPAAE